jgi:hypothetical protein
MRELHARGVGQSKLRLDRREAVASPTGTAPTSEFEVPGRRVRLLRTKELLSFRQEQPSGLFSFEPLSCSSRGLPVSLAAHFAVLE